MSEPTFDLNTGMLASKYLCGFDNYYCLQITRSLETGMGRNCAAIFIPHMKDVFPTYERFFVQVTGLSKMT